MYKGHKVTKRLERYIDYAEVRYHKLRVQGQIDLWDILKEYKHIAKEPYCVQLYIYDLIKGEGVHGEYYEVVRWINGGIYVRECGNRVVFAC